MTAISALMARGSIAAPAAGKPGTCDAAAVLIQRGRLPLVPLIVWLALAACGGGAKQSSAQQKSTVTPVEKGGGEASCQQAADHLFEVTSADKPADVRATSLKAFVHRCETD